MHFPPGFDALGFEVLAMGREPLGGGRFRLLPVHQARGFPGTMTGRTECRFDQRPVQRGFGLRGQGLHVDSGPLRPGFRAGPALGSAGRRDQRLEGFRRLGGRAKAIVRVGREQSVDDRDQAVGEARPDVRDRDMTLPDPLDEPILPGHAGEGIGPREQAVHRAAETEEVRPDIDRIVLDLLGRHEIGRPDHDAFVGIEDVARLPGHPDQFPESEVEHLHDPRLDEEHVRRLDIAVDHPLLVRVGETPRGLRHVRR